MIVWKYVNVFVVCYSRFYVDFLCFYQFPETSINIRLGIMQNSLSECDYLLTIVDVYKHRSFQLVS